MLRFYLGASGAGKSTKLYQEIIERSIKAPEQNFFIIVPDQFTMELSFPQIVGMLPEEETTTPEIPQELRDERDQAVADAGLNEDDYENFTEEQQETQNFPHAPSARLPAGDRCEISCGNRR